MAGIQQEEQEQESPVLPTGSLHRDAANSEPNPPSTIATLTRDKNPDTSCNLLSWFRHPLAAFTASLKRRRCASSGDNPKAGRKKKVEILGDACAEDEAAEAKTLEKMSSTSDPELLADAEPIIPKAVGATTTAHIVDCLNDDDDVNVKKEDMAIAGKEEKAKAKEQQGSPENVVEKKWVGEPVDITGGNNHKAAITLPNDKQPESAPITSEEAAAAKPVATAGGLGQCCWEMNQQLAAGTGIQDAAENTEEAAPATDGTVTAVSGIRETK